LAGGIRNAVAIAVLYAPVAMLMTGMPKPLC